MDAWLLFFSTCLPKSQESNRRVPLGGTNTQRLHWRRRGWAWGRSLLPSRSSGLPPEAAPVVVVLCCLGSGCPVVREGVKLRRGAVTAKWSLDPGGEMDILKSEIQRKRQLVEDRNLLVVRVFWLWSLDSRLVFLCVDGCWGEGDGLRGVGPSVGLTDLPSHTGAGCQPRARKSGFEP